MDPQLLDGSAADEAARKRKYHTRSRQGCLTCRRRHVRCDERRPQCTNCAIGSRPCEYPAHGAPLKDRRLQTSEEVPGKQEVWQAVMQYPKTAVDPFDSLPIKMTLKSRELFHYFAQVNQVSSQTPGDPRNDCVAYASRSHEETALRSTLLIAAMHHSWNRGGFEAFQATFLHHKVECIRLVNDWLANLNATNFPSCLRLIGTLSVIECGLGNVTEAKAHLDGILAILHMKETKAKTFGVSRATAQEEELLERLFVLVFHFMYATEGRLVASRAEGVDLMHQWLKIDTLRHVDRLEALRLFPYYFADPETSASGKLSTNIDAEPILEAFHILTSTLDDCHDRPEYSTPAARVRRAWTCGAQASMLRAMTEIHVSSVYEEAVPSPRPRYWSSWLGLASAGGFFLQCVLGIWNAGEPFDYRFAWRMLIILKKDVEQTEPEMRADTCSRDLWFWKAFNAAFALAHGRVGVEVDDGESFDATRNRLAIEGLRSWLGERIRDWSELTGYATWTEAREALHRIQWPRFFEREELARSVWDTAVAKGHRGLRITGREVYALPTP